ncbi:hypothetical protein ACFW2Y_21940 [Streptomyces sp. NPDC058877]|uniref:hypothetical protein n=1 Tax=unclassified Streptomyces TaxID=2593676 RepID=UPI0036C05B29
MRVSELARDAGLIEPRRYVVDWARVESELGTGLPSDYKDFVYWFGPGNFSDYFTVSVPGVENSNVDFMSNVRAEWNAYNVRNGVDDLPPVPFQFFPQPGGWLPFLVTVEGCAVFWVTEGDDPDRWTIGSRNRMWRPQFFDGGFSDFLRQAIWDTIELEAIPEYGHEPPLAFRSNDGSWRGGGGTRLEAYGCFEEA